MTPYTLRVKVAPELTVSRLSLVRLRTAEAWCTAADGCLDVLLA